MLRTPSLRTRLASKETLRKRGDEGDFDEQAKEGFTGGKLCGG
jgi:hypothetical protein